MTAAAGPWEAVTGSAGVMGWCGGCWIEVTAGGLARHDENPCRTGVAGDLDQVDGVQVLQ